MKKDQAETYQVSLIPETLSLFASFGDGRPVSRLDMIMKPRTQLEVGPGMSRALRLEQALRLGA